jgi:hypothetical protein
MGGQQRWGWGGGGRGLLEKEQVLEGVFGGEADEIGVF